MSDSEITPDMIGMNPSKGDFIVGTEEEALRDYEERIIRKERKRIISFIKVNSHIDEDGNEVFTEYTDTIIDEINEEWKK